MSEIIAEVVALNQDKAHVATATLYIMPDGASTEFDSTGKIELEGRLIGAPDGRVAFRYGNGPLDIFYFGDRFVLELKRLN